MQSIATESMQEIAPSNTKRNPLIESLSLFAYFALLLGCTGLAIHADVILLHGTVQDNSVIESLQDVYLLTSCLLFITVAVRQPRQRGFAVLVGGFFAVLLIRELDGVLDYVYHGFWKVPALIVSGYAIWFAYKHKQDTLNDLARYLQHPTFSLMLGGMASLLIFSRIFGMSELWQALMGDNYIHSVKNLAEEGVELLSYTLIVFAAGWYTLPQLFRKAPTDIH
ncbi:hypothetical protein [Photobacterium aquae]|uniref:hypothetical protein n=1 Tax=Photobacterium aquae TaxID=1195763 RepID=UPI00069E0820|nr:hypothetical protein [Photobacterium aquae]